MTAAAGTQGLSPSPAPQMCPQCSDGSQEHDLLPGQTWEEFGGPKLNTEWRDLQPLSLPFSVILVHVAVGPSSSAPLIKIFATYEVPTRC